MAGLAIFAGEMRDLGRLTRTQPRNITVVLQQPYPAIVPGDSFSDLNESEKIHGRQQCIHHQ
jgi:hypothetical protein